GVVVLLFLTRNILIQDVELFLREQHVVKSLTHLYHRVDAGVSHFLLQEYSSGTGGLGCEEKVIIKNVLSGLQCQVRIVLLSEGNDLSSDRLLLPFDVVSAPEIGIDLRKPT